MKNLFKILTLLLAVTFIFTSCNPNKVKPDPIDQVEDGIYVVGEGTADTALNINALMKVTPNEVTQENRAELMEIYISVKAGTGGFNIVKVAGTTITTYGPGTDFAKVETADLDTDEPKDGLWRGSYVVSDTKFTVPEDGLYHVVIDTELGICAVAKADWGVIGGATPGGWSGSTELPSAGFDLKKMTFTATNMILLVDQFKFRYSNGWKIILDATYDLGDGVQGIKVNSNFGGTVDALVPGGANIENTVVGVYTVSMTWEYGKGMTAKLTKTGNYTPPAYPDSLYISGDASSYGWATPGDSTSASFHKVADSQNDGVFWKICYLDATGSFKIAAKGWASPNIGFAQVDEFDANGVTVSSNDGNMQIATSGMYMIVVDLRNDLIKVSVSTPKVYGIGDAFTDWTEQAPANLFTIDDVNKTLVSPALPTSGNIRMYVSHAWIPAWWNAEFVVDNSAIVYRNNGGDPATIPGTAGQIITLHFDDNTGSIN